MKKAPEAGTMLVPNIDSNFLNPAEKDAFFSAEELRILKKYERREKFNPCKPSESCKSDLFFGFFFDGTKNNYFDAETGKNHSNVARLYDCFPGECVADIFPTTTDWVWKFLQSQLLQDIVRGEPNKATWHENLREQVRRVEVAQP